MSDGSDASPTTLQRQLSRLVWRSGLKPGLTPEQRRASWAGERRECMTRAGRMLRLMEEEGLAITLVGAPRSSASQAAFAEE